MAMIRFDPVRELLTLQDRMNRLFDGSATEDALTMRGSWVPPVDIYETDGHDLVISAELPDMRREDITVTVVSVRGNKVKLAFNAPMEVPIHRAEVHQRLEQEDFATATGQG